MSKFSRVMEMIWLAMAIGCFGLGAYSTLTVGLQESYMLFLLTVLAAVMYSLRRYHRVRGARSQAGQGEKPAN